MKKILFIFILLTCLFLDLEFADVNADGKSDSMGFAVDYSRYGGYKSYDIEDMYYTAEGVTVGYAEFQSAVYEDINDEDYVVVIYYLTIEPYDTKIGAFSTYKAHTQYATIESDVDGAFENFGYGYYASSSSYEMRNPSPSPVSGVTSYSASISVGSSVSVSGSVSVEKNELIIDTDHSSSNDDFSVEYDYRCILFGADCSYSRAETYQKATFMIDKSAVSTTTYRRFINEAFFNIRFYHKGIWHNNSTEGGKELVVIY